MKGRSLVDVEMKMCVNGIINNCTVLEYGTKKKFQHHYTNQCENEIMYRLSSDGTTFTKYL